jgi:DNA-binding CsgD family transcriptional regulator
VLQLRGKLPDVIERTNVEELTPCQRQDCLAIMAGGMPMEEVARRMNTNRNALY